MNDFSSLGENLKAIRDKRGLNLNDVSELTGISKAMLSKIERGESVPTITTVWKIANGLKITLNALAGEVDSNYAVRDIVKTTPLKFLSDRHAWPYSADSSGTNKKSAADCRSGKNFVFCLPKEQKRIPPPALSGSGSGGFPPRDMVLHFAPITAGNDLPAPLAIVFCR